MSDEETLRSVIIDQLVGGTSLGDIILSLRETYNKVADEQLEEMSDDDKQKILNAVKGNDDKKLVD